MTFYTSNKTEGLSYQENRTGTSPHMEGTSWDDNLELFYGQGNMNGQGLYYFSSFDGGEGYDVVDVDWAYGNGSQDWEWEYDALNNSYTFNLTMPGHKSTSYTTFDLYNVEEVRFGNGTWYQPESDNMSAGSTSSEPIESDLSYEGEYEYDDYGYDDDYSYDNEITIEDSGSVVIGNVSVGSNVSTAQSDSPENSNNESNSLQNGEALDQASGIAQDPVTEYNYFEGSWKKEKIKGTNYSDEIFGYGGADKINGKGGDDVIDPGFWTKGKFDKVKGGSGSDTFVIKDGYWASIQDFKIVEDSLDLTGLSNGWEWDSSKRRTSIYDADGYEVARFKGRVDLSSADLV